MPKMRVKLTRRLFLLLRSARFLINDRDGAKEDFEESIAIMPSLVQSRVKLASVHMELSEFRFVLFFESDSARDETTTLTFSRLLFQTTSPTPSETSKPPSLRTLSIPISTTTEDRVRSLFLSLPFLPFLLLSFPSTKLTPRIVPSLSLVSVYFIAGELDKAMDDYAKSTELDSNFIFSHIQRAVTQFRLEKVPLAMSSFRSILKQFPDRSEGYNY